MGTFLSVQVPEIFLRWITLGHEFLLMLQSYVSMEQRENALSSGQARLQGDMLLVSRRSMEHSNLCVFLHLWKSYSLHSFISEVLEIVYV